MLGTCPNTADSQLFENTLAALRRGLPELEMGAARPEPAVLCGGGPSLVDDLDTVLKLQSLGGKVFALNNAAQFLSEHGIRADYQVVLDARQQNVEFVQFDRAETLLLGSQCHPDVFDAAISRGANIQVWNHGSIEYGQKIKEALGRESPVLMIGGSHTVGLCAMCAAWAMGHYRLHLFGYDSSHREDKGHAYPQSLNANDELLRVAVDNKAFTASVAMAAQARAFPGVAQALADQGVEIHVHGQGLLPHIAKMMQNDVEKKVMTAVYDLAVAPPTYDFVTFLAAAEDFRKQRGFDAIDVIFQPGPIEGFRDDNLPPSVNERKAMLWRVCVQATRLLQTVRNVEVLRERREVAADFPLGYQVEAPIPCYGATFFKGADPVFSATPSARQIAQKITGDTPYMVIPVRQAEYWPNRNTNIEAWKYAVRPFEAMGWNVFWIPDTNGPDVPQAKNVRSASLDIDLRMALYEGARLVTGLIGGAACLAVFSEAKYLFFHHVESGPTTERSYLERLGLEMNEQWTPRGKVIYGADEQFAARKALWEHFYGEKSLIEEVALAHND